MTTWNCRFIVPAAVDVHGHHATTDAWTPVECDIDDWRMAALQFHADAGDFGLQTARETETYGREVVFLAKVEVEGHGETITRMFKTGIWRRGGMKPNYRAQLREIAVKLGWTDDPSLLLEDGWEGEEPEYEFPGCNRR